MVAFQCEECDKVYVSKSNLNRHIKRFHNDDDDLPSEDDDLPSEDEEEEEEQNESMDEISEEVDEDDHQSEENIGDVDGEENVIENDSGVWEFIARNSEEPQNDISNAYKELVIMMKALQRSSTHRSVMKTLQKVKHEEGMDYMEALDYAVYKRRFLINRHIQNST